MRKIQNVLSPKAYGLKNEYCSDGGWEQYLPAKGGEEVVYVENDDSYEEHVIKLAAGEVVEFTPTEYNWETRRSVYEITIR